MSIVTSTLNINNNNKLVSIEPDTFLEANPEFSKASDVSNITNELSSHIENTNNPHNVTKEQVGLGNVDNDSNDVLLGINEYESLITENKTIIGSINENKTNIDTKQNILTAGNNITIKNNIISAVDTIYNPSSSDSNGLMTSEQYNKLESIETGAQVNKVLSVANRIGDIILSKEDVGLNNVDNTSDINKPVSNQTQNELNKKQNILINIEGITSDTVENALKELKSNINTNTDNIALKANDSEVIKKALLDSIIPESGGSSDNTPSTAAIVNALNNVKSTIVNVFHYKGSKETYEELPSVDNQVGDVWNVVESYDKYPAGTNYAWTGTQWDALGGETDLTPYQTKEDDTLKTVSKTIVAAINENKASIDSHIGNTNNPHNVTKEQIELGNVDNTSDINKPISLATQDALNLKQNSTDNNLNTTSKIIVDAINEVNTNTNNKANKATTLSGYGITDAYTKAEVGSDINELEANLTTQINSGLVEKAETNASNIGEFINDWKSTLGIDVVETNLNNKQDKLTAGSNITISNNNISVTGVVPEALVATQDSNNNIITSFYAPLSSLNDKQDKLTTYKETLKTIPTDNDSVQIVARGSDSSGNVGKIELIANSAEIGSQGGTIILNTSTLENSEGNIILNGKISGTVISTSIPASESAVDTKVVSEKAVKTELDKKQDKLLYYSEVSGDTPSATISVANIKLKGSVAEGQDTTASGKSSHAEGYNTTASAFGSHAEGCYTIASRSYQHVQGQYNIEDANGKYADIIGNGTAEDARSNAATVSWNGISWSQTDVRAGGTDQDNAIHSLSNKQNKLSTYSEIVDNEWTNVNIKPVSDYSSTKGAVILGYNTNEPISGPDITLCSTGQTFSGAITLDASSNGGSGSGIITLKTGGGYAGGEINLTCADEPEGASSKSSIKIGSKNKYIRISDGKIAGTLVDSAVPESYPEGDTTQNIPTTKAVYNYVQAQSPQIDWNATSGKNQILNKPNISSTNGIQIDGSQEDGGVVTINAFDTNAMMGSHININAGTTNTPEASFITLQSQYMDMTIPQATTDKIEIGEGHIKLDSSDLMIPIWENGVKTTNFAGIRAIKSGDTITLSSYIIS